MVTDGILCAVQGMVDRFDTAEQKKAGEAIYEMLADFNEDDWEALHSPRDIGEWLDRYIEQTAAKN